MNNANTAIYDKVVDRAAMLRLYERSVAKKILATLMEHENTANEIIAANNAKFDKKLQEAIDAQISKTYKELYSTSSRSLLDLVTDQVSYAYQTLETAVGNIWKTQKPNRRVAEDLVLNNPLFNNVVLSAGWTGIGVAERKRIESTIRRGIAQGLNEKEIALAVRKGNIFNISRNQSIGLSRTAITSVYAQADQQVYEANKGILAGWQYVAVLDSRTTPLCAHRDGKIYPVDDKRHLPPAHWHCRSTTVPVVKNWADLKDAKNIAQIRKRNLQNLTDEEKAFYDGMTPSKESYDAWLRRQPPDVQLKHFGDTQKLKLFQQGQLTVDKFSDNGRDLSLKELRSQTDPEYGIPGDTRKFAFAKEQLESLAIGASRPEDFYGDKKLTEALKDYYRLQAGDLNGTLSYTDYRGTLVHVKRATKQRVLSTPPTEDNLKFNPLTNKYEDARLYQPAPAVLQNNLRLVKESEKLLPEDKEFIESFVNSLETTVSLNQRAVITDNLRITFSRYRDNQIPWNNLKAVLNGQMKFDVMNVSDYIETQLRKDRDILANLKKMEFVDPVLGPTSLQDLHDTFIDNIFERKSWEFSEAPKIARRLRNVLDRKIPPKIWVRLDDADLKEFYLNFAKRLAFSDTPDRDQLAIYLGRDLYNLANYRGTRNEWYNLGVKLLDDAKDKGFYELETYGVQKRRMKSRIGGNYFGPVYETPMVVIRITDPKIRKFAILTRKVDLGLRVGVTTGKNRLVIRPGYKTYFDVKNRDTGIPIVSADSMSYFPDDMIDENMAEALNWAAKSEFKVDKDYYEAIKRLLYFKDDKGKAKYYDELNEYRKHIVSRGDSYERFKAMEWLVENDSAFSNHPFIDHRARIYDRGFIGPQAGETFRPFLNTAKTKSFSPEDFQNLQDHIGAFLGGLSDKLEGNYNSLTVLGRQKVAEKWRPELIKIGDHLRRGKPNDLRAVLESEMLAEIDGEDMGKTLRFAIEMSKIKEFLEQSRKTPKEGVFSKNNLVNLKNYQTGLALEQDASSSGAQIIALTTRNKKLAELSNVIPTNQKKRLYDEIAAATFNDPRFREINKRLGLTEKDLRKAAKAQNMVTFYGAGERTGILNVEGKLAKALAKQDGKLVVRLSDRDKVLDEISARAARYKEFDPETFDELMQLRKDVKEIFNKGQAPGDDIMEQLYFLSPQTKDLVEKMTLQYDAVVTPEDFTTIGRIMSENLGNEVPILKDFTKFFGRLGEDFLINAKPKEAFIDWKDFSKKKVLGTRSYGARLNPRLAEILGTDPKEPITEKVLKRFSWWNPNSTFADLFYGVKESKFRADPKSPIPKFKDPLNLGGIASKTKRKPPPKLPKSWTQLPWVNFDGKIVEQKFTQVFEERLRYRTSDGQWVTNIVQVPQKTDPTWWEEFTNQGNKINEIVDAQRARTAFGVNGNHSNDATLVKNFHRWGSKTNTPTATVHDAFFTNAADLIPAKEELRKLYAKSLERNVIKLTLDEMKARGLPDELYNQYLNEAMDLGLIPIPGRSKVGGKVLTEKDILTVQDILEDLPKNFSSNRFWYGIGG